MQIMPPRNEQTHWLNIKYDAAAFIIIDAAAATHIFRDRRGISDGDSIEIKRSIFT